MARGGKVQYRENYTPETPTREDWQTVDLVLFWLSGVAIGLIVALLATGN